MLPHPTSLEFPAALKAAREAKGMSRSALAHAAGIHKVMPRRYEEPTCSEFTRPTEKTMLVLNQALGFTSADPTTRTVEHSPPMPAASLQSSNHAVSLCEASIDEIAAELRRRGIVATLTFPV